MYISIVQTCVATCGTKFCRMGTPGDSGDSNRNKQLPMTVGSRQEPPGAPKRSPTGPRHLVQHRIFSIS